jgi:hypothetical protein
MNKRRNKSVTKTQHRVQKTKRSRRLNKNRSVKGIRGNNKTKVVGKRRNIVQRGGGNIDVLVSRIYGLDEIPSGDVKDSKIDSILSDIEQSNLLQVASDPKQPRSDMTPTGSTLLYAACRLQNPSIDLVRRILFEKMKITKKGLFTKDKMMMYSIIPNGSANGSYPQHAAVQAIKQILDGISPHSQPILFIDDTNKNRILNIFTILQLLKKYDNELAEHIRLRKQVITPDEFKEDTHTPLMSKTNHFKLTAYQEYANSFNGKPSIRYILASMPQQEGHVIRTFRIEEFDEVLASTGPVSVAAGSAGDASALPPGWEEFSDPQTGRIYYGNQQLETTQWVRPVISSAAPSPVSVAAGSAGDASALPLGWEEIISPDGRIYYGNKVLGTTQWERPVISSAAPSPVSVAAGSAGAAPPSYHEVMGNLTKYPLFDPKKHRTVLN